MQHFSTEQLLKLNHIGLIPGPGETADAFAKRTDYCLHLYNHLSEELKTSLDGDISPQHEVMEKAEADLIQAYDTAPGWIPLFFSNYKLPFWQGGCAWIFQVTEESPTAALIQLRRAFKASKRYLGIYDRDELLTHELCHVGRMMFHEPRYEEVLAYRTARSPFRCWFGPLVQSSMESMLFLLTIFILGIFDVFLITMQRSEAYLFFFWLKLIPVGLMIAALGRLWKRQKTFNACISALTHVSGSAKAKAIVYRLTDQEITTFAGMTSQQVKEYAASQKELRWQVINAAYL